MHIVKIIFNRIIYPDRTLFRFIRCNSLFPSNPAGIDPQAQALLNAQYPVGIDLAGLICTT